MPNKFRKKNGRRKKGAGAAAPSSTEQIVGFINVTGSGSSSLLGFSDLVERAARLRSVDFEVVAGTTPAFVQFTIINYPSVVKSKVYCCGMTTQKGSLRCNSGDPFAVVLADTKFFEITHSGACSVSFTLHFAVRCNPETTPKYSVKFTPHSFGSTPAQTPSDADCVHQLDMLSISSSDE